MVLAEVVFMKLLGGTWHLKIAALLLAVLSYFYIHKAIESLSKKETDPSYKLIKLTAKSLPVKVRLATLPPDGYRILTDDVGTTPNRLIVIGPEALLDEASSAETALVDVSESTRNAAKKVPLESVAGIHVTGEPYYVDVTVPIEKIEEEKTPQS